MFNNSYTVEDEAVMAKKRVDDNEDTKDFMNVSILFVLLYS